MMNYDEPVFNYTDPIELAQAFDEYIGSRYHDELSPEEVWKDDWPKFEQMIWSEVIENSGTEEYGEIRQEDVQSALTKVVHTLEAGKFDEYLKEAEAIGPGNVVEQAEQLINPTDILGEYRKAIRLENYEEAGELWDKMTSDEKAQARNLFAHRRGIRKLAFNDMFGKGWDSGKQYSYCMQRSLQGDPQFWWVPEVLELFPEPPPNWDAVDRGPDGRFKEFPANKEKKESSWNNRMYRFAYKLYTSGHNTEGRMLLSLLREIK